MNRRSRNGCVDCRKSKVKCDEIRPFCGTCTRRRHVCQGYVTPLPLQTAYKTGSKQNRRELAAQARARSQRSTTADNVADDELESSIDQAQSPPSEYSSSIASPPTTDEVSLIKHPLSHLNEPVTSTLSSSKAPKAGHPLIVDPAQLSTLRALCLIPPGVITPSDEATVEVYFTRHPCEIIMGPEFVNEMNANVLMVLQHNPQAIVDALSAIGHCYLTSSASDSSLTVLNYRARILATLRAMGSSKNDLEDMILLLLGLCAMELVDSKTTPPETTIPVIVANAACLINHHVSSGREVSSLARYFIRALARQDMIISMVQLRRLTIPTSVWLEEDAQASADRLMGYTMTLMPLLEELCALAEDVRNLLENANQYDCRQEQEQEQEQEQRRQQQASLPAGTLSSSSSPNANEGSEEKGPEFIEDGFKMNHGGYNMINSGDYSHSTTFESPNMASEKFIKVVQRAEDVRVRIEMWKPSLPHGMSFRRSRRFLSQASCYRSGALLYLFRLLEPPSTPCSNPSHTSAPPMAGGSQSFPQSPSPSPPSGACSYPCSCSCSCSTLAADGEATAKAHEVLMATSVANVDELKMLLWPVFLAACEMSAEEDRQVVLDIFDAILEQRRTVTAQRTKMFVLNRVWKARDEGREWNWMVLAREFPGECLPI